MKNKLIAVAVILFTAFNLLAQNQYYGKFNGTGSNVTDVVNQYNAAFANQIFVDGVAGSDITGNGTITAPYMTITNAQAVDIASYNNLYTVVVERGFYDLKSQSILLTNNSSMYFYSGVVLTNTYFLIAGVSNSTITVQGALNMYPGLANNGACYFNTDSNVVVNFGTPQAPINYLSQSVGTFGIFDGISTPAGNQSIQFNAYFNSFLSPLSSCGANRTKGFTNSTFHITAYQPSGGSYFLAQGTAALGNYPYTNAFTVQLTCPQFTYTGAASYLYQPYAKVILDPMVFITSAYPSVSQTNMVMVLRNVEMTTWPTNLLLNNPPNLFTNSFWP